MKPFLRFALTFLFLTLSLKTADAAVSVISAFLTTAQADNQCNPGGPPVTSYPSTASAAWLYLEVSGAAVGDRLTVDWFDPTGKNQVSTNFNALTSSGTFCFSASINIAGTLVASLPGNWNMRATYNGSTLVSLPFAITGGSSGGNCVFAVNPLTVSAPTAPAIAAGGTGSIAVTASAGSCAWTAGSNSSFITINSGSSGTGSGTVSYTVAANTTSSARTGTMTVAGQTVTISQAAGAGCAYALNPVSNSVSSAGGAGSFTVSTSAGCAWTATTNTTWINISSGASGSGSGTVNYTAAANTGSSRTGTITVAGQTFNLSQSANTIAPGGAVIGFGPGAGVYTLNRIEVTRTYLAGFGAAQNVISPGSTTYPATQTSFQMGWDYSNSVIRNRFVDTVTLTNVPQTVTPTVTATLAAALTADWNASGYGMDRPHLYQADDGFHDGGFQPILQGTPGPENGIGSGNINATFTKPAPAALNGEVRLVLIGALNFQDQGWGRIELDFVYTNCSAASITPPSQQPAATGGSVSVPVSATAGCPWSATVLAGSSWLTASPATSSGSGSVTLTAAANAGASYRGAVVNIAGQLLAVTQAPGNSGTGAYTLSRIDLKRSYDSNVASAAANPIQAGSQTFQGSGLYLGYQAGWDSTFPSDPGELLLPITSRNRFVSFLNFDGVPASVTPGASATVGVDMTGDWVANTFGISRFHTLSTTGAASGQAQSPTSNPDGTGLLTFTSASTPQIVPQANASGEVHVVVNGRVDFDSAGGVSLQADLVYIGGPGGGGGTCTFTLGSSGVTLPQTGGTGSVPFTASSSTCAWTAAATGGFLNLTSAASGTGSGSVSFSASANTTTSTRTGTITVGGQTYTVTQPGLPACSFTVSPLNPATISASGATGGITITASASSCAWTASANATWLHINGPSSGSGSATVNYSADANTSSARSGTLTVAGQTVTIQQAAAPTCSFTVNPLNPAILAAAGASGSITITASDSSCLWTASANATWLHLTSAASGSGSATLGYSADANIGAARTGTITVAGQIVTIQQAAATPACTYTLNPQNAPALPGGGTGSFTVTPSASSCAWTAVASGSFVTVTSGASGTGNGTVNYSVQANTGAARTGTITVSGQGGQATFTLNQGTSQITPGQPFFVDGKSNIWAAGQPSTSDGLLPPFYRFNPGAGQVVTVSNVTGTASCSPQPGVCPAAIGPDGTSGGNNSNAVQGISGLISRSNGYFMVGVFLDDNAATGKPPESLDFTNFSFTKINPKIGQVFFIGDGLSGTGTGTQQQFFVPPTATRIFFGLSDAVGSSTFFNDDSGGFNVTMNLVPGGPPCSYSLTPNPDNVAAAGGPQSVAVSTQAGCFWSSTVNDAFITVDPNASSNSTGTMPFSVAANTGATSRTGTVLIADQTLSVVQAAPGGSTPNCTFTLSPTSAQVAAGGTGAGHLTFQVTASASSCTWIPAANVSWLHVSGGKAGAGSGSVDYTVDANTGPARQGTFTVGGQTFTVNQSAAVTCSFTLSASNATAPPTAATGKVTFTASDSSCPWTAFSNTSWIAVTGAGSGTGSGFATYEMEPNPGPARQGSITVAGKTFTINQSANVPVDCAFTLSPPSATYTSSGGTATFTVTPATSTCAWTATNTPGFVSITSSTAGTGTGAIGYSVTPNTGAARTATITVTIQSASHTFNISQDAPPPVCAVTLPVTNATAPAGGTGGTIAVNDGPGCAWAATFPSWITPTGPSTGTGNGTLGYAVAPNTGPARTGAIGISGQNFTVTQAAGASPCQYTLSPTSQSVQPGGGPGQVLVITDASCQWTAASNDPFITVTPPSSGAGSSVVNYAVTANTGSTARAGSLTIGSINFPITQAAGTGAACSITLNPGSLTAQPAGGPGQLAVSAATGCTWQVSATSWITINSPTSGNGSSTVQFTVQPNTAAGATARDGAITIGTQTFAVHQAAGAPAACVYSLSPASKSATVTGGADSFTVTTATGCVWTATTNNPDIVTVTSGSASGNGNGTVNYSVSQNAGTGTRTGTITVQGQTFTVTQPGTGNTPANPCVFALTPSSQSATPAGGAAQVSVGVATGCSWQAVSNNADWIVITTGASGAGSGSVNYSVQPNNTSSARTGSMTIGGVQFPITQPAITASGGCPFTLNPASQTALAAGGPGQFTVNTQTGCTWQPVSNNPDWLTITNAGGGAGSATVNYNVAPNTTSAARTGTITAGTATFTVTQSAGTGTGATNCANQSINPSLQSALAAGGTNQVTVTAPTGCAWTAVSNNSDWLTVTNGGSGSGNGTVTYSVAAYTGAAPRTGTITIAGQSFTVTQSSPASQSPCTYSFSPPSQSSDGNGGPGQTIVSTSTGCAWNAASDSPWLSITTGAAGSGSGLVNYSVGAYPSGAPRTGVLTLTNGSTASLAQFQVTQTSGSGQACSFTITPQSQPSTSAGGAGQVAVTVATGCTWAATSNNADFLTITAGGSGNGSGTLSYSVAANSGAQRTGTITVVTGVTFSVTQDSSGTNSGGPANAGCSYSLSPTSQSALAGGGASQFSVSTATGCSWTAVSNNTDFLTVTTGGGSGTGTVTYSVGPNSGAARTGAITVAGQSFTVQQAAVAAPGAAPAPAGSCNVTLNPGSNSASSAAGSAQIQVTVSTGCSWSANSNNSDWLTITGGSSGSGNGTVTYAFAPNTGSARTGSLSIGGVSFPVTQSASGSGAPGANNSNCNYTLNPTSQAAKASGGPAQLSVTATSGCTWTAASNNPDWLSITAGASGNGQGTVDYSVQANTAATSRTGTLTVAGSTFVVSQDAAGPNAGASCSYSLSPPSQSATAAGGSGQVTITTAVGCAWTTTSANADWISVVSDASGNGPGSFTYSIQANSTQSARTGSINVAGATFSVSQAAAASTNSGGVTSLVSSCTYTVTPSSQSSAASGGSGSVSVTAALGCSWTATGSVDWLVVTAGGAGNGSAGVTYSVSPNSGAARVGALSVAGQTVTVMQSGAPGTAGSPATAAGSCNYAVSPANQSASSAGGADTVNVLAPVGCTWSAVPSVDWLSIVSGGSGSGSGVVNYSAAANATAASRTGTIAVAGQTVTVTQGAAGSAGSGCTYSLSTSAQQATSDGGSGTVSVSAGAGCPWTATSSGGSIAITSGNSGSGNGTVTYSVPPNSGSGPQSGTLTIGGQTLSITQAAAGANGSACSYTLTPSTASDAGTGSSGQTIVSAPLGCSWTATSNNSDWLTVIDSGAGQGNGVVTFGASPNSSGVARIGTIAIGGQTLTISQNASAAGGPLTAGPVINVGGVVNAASFAPPGSPAGAISQGSFFSIFGSNMGPLTPAGVTDFPLANSLGGVTIQISQGSTQVNAIPHYVSAGQINAILPSNAPVGTVQITVTYQGVTSNPVSFQVAPNNWGSFSNPAGGTGPGIIQNVVTATQYDLNTPANSARPGQIEIIWGTGLGAIAGPDNIPPPVGNLAAPVEVTVGGVPASIAYSGRTPCCSAVDNIYFTVPAAAPVGCAVPVQVTLNGSNVSNTVTIAISKNGGACN